MLSKRWLFAEAATQEQLARFRGMHPILAQVLINRGFEDPRDANRFLAAKDVYGKDKTFDPFLMPDMEKAVERILQAIRNEEKIVVYGDFDADGVTSTTLLVEALTAFGANVRPYIPNRVDEGYGLNSPAIIEMANRGVTLIVTVDCGIRSIDEVEQGKAVGIDIVVTDHHSLGPEVPDAYAVVNPKREGYPEPMLAGVGVAFKLVQAMTMYVMQDKQFLARLNGHASKNGSPYPIRLDKLYDLVAIGTVADLMPLHHIENRALVRRGLDVLRRAERPGIRALLDVARVQPADVTSTTIGFAIGPRINAAGRLASAMTAYHLLSAQTEAEARQWAQRLQDLNTERQTITRDAQATIRDEIDDYDTASLIFASHEGFLPGIVGLVAGRLTEEFYRPSVVMELGDEESRASCRSIPQFDITSALDECADLLVRHGGHALAAGFTVANENIEPLRERLTQLADDMLSGQTLEPTLDVDMEVDIHQLTRTLVNELDLLEPCGNGNPAPVFVCRNVHVAEHRTVGKDNKHLKLKVSRAAKPPLDAIGFGLGDWVSHMPERIDMAFTLEINEWNGYSNLQANLQDIRKAE